MAFTPITDNMDCLTAAIVGELVAGLDQRRLAAGGGAFGIPTPAVGDDAHAAPPLPPRSRVDLRA